MFPQLEDFQTEWGEPDPTYLDRAIPPPVEMPLTGIFSPAWVDWITNAAKAKSAPPDYVVAALLATSASLIANVRWGSPWQSWREPTILWAMNIGTPSMNKSPAMDAVLDPLRKIEAKAMKEFEAQMRKWQEQADVAAIFDLTWKEAVTKATKTGDTVPDRPAEADAGPRPRPARRVMNDATIEKLAFDLSRLLRGLLLFRDELSAWITGMTRYSGSTDQSFWLEAYGGRPYVVDRMGRESVTLQNLSIGVLGSIQPDRLRTLLLKSDNDGLTARFLTFWPNPAPIQRPCHQDDGGFLKAAYERLLSLEMQQDEEGRLHPVVVPFTSDAQDLLDIFRHEARDLEATADGMLHSFIGKLPGLAVRVATVLTFLDYAATGEEEPCAINLDAIGRSMTFLKEYALPMARRTFAEDSLPKSEKAARQLLDLLAERKEPRFSVRDIQRLRRKGLSRKADLDPALRKLEEAELIRPASHSPGPNGGAPPRLYLVNPVVFAKG